MISESSFLAWYFEDLKDYTIIVRTSKVTYTVVYLDMVMFLLLGHMLNRISLGQLSGVKPGMEGRWSSMVGDRKSMETRDGRFLYTEEGERHRSELPIPGLRMKADPRTRSQEQSSSSTSKRNPSSSIPRDDSEGGFGSYKEHPNVLDIHEEVRNLYGVPALRLNEGMLSIFIRPDASS